MTEPTRNFDPATYIQNAGWDYAAIQATAEQGVSQEDERILEEMYGEIGGPATSAVLMAHCRARTSRPTAIICVRSQHSVGSSSNRFGGPDRYVAVQIVPAGVEPLRCLRSDVAARRGIRIRYCGEGYSRNSGPRSMLGQALAKADEIAAQYA